MRGVRESRYTRQGRLGAGGHQRRAHGRLHRRSHGDGGRSSTAGARRASRARSNLPFRGGREERQQRRPGFRIRSVSPLAGARELRYGMGGAGPMEKVGSERRVARSCRSIASSRHGRGTWPPMACAVARHSWAPRRELVDGSRPRSVDLQEALRRDDGGSRRFDCQHSFQNRRAQPEPPRHGGAASLVGRLEREQAHGHPGAGEGAVNPWMAMCGMGHGDAHNQNPSWRQVY